MKSTIAKVETYRVSYPITGYFKFFKSSSDKPPTRMSSRRVMRPLNRRDFALNVSMVAPGVLRNPFLSTRAWDYATSQ